MTSARFKLDVYEGPLDLLLNLINTHKLNIYDIEITLLLEQYMEYINNLEYEDYEEASDFLEMAARLIYIKTCSLLPHDEEGEELKKELEGRLIEYSICKSAADKLRKSCAMGDIFVRKAVKLPVNKTYSRIHEPTELYNAYMGISAKARKAKPLRAAMFEPIVSHKIVSVTSKIIYVLKKLYRGGEFDMAHLYDGMKSKSEQVATFLAVLELTKSGRIFLNDDNSKIFFNSGCKRKKIVSDFDDTAEDQTTGQADNELIAPQDCEAEIPFEEISEFNDEVTEESMGDLYHKEISALNDRIKPLHPKSMSERITAVECMADVKEFDEDILENDKSNVQILSEDTIQNAVDEDIHNDEKTVFDDAFFAEVEEIKLLAGLSDEPPADLFKPSYWNRLKYHWGNCSVGADNDRNYWKYGYMRI